MSSPVTNPAPEDIGNAFGNHSKRLPKKPTRSCSTNNVHKITTTIESA